MKSEERHRLKHNALADTLADLPDVIKEQGPRTLGLIMVGLCLFFGVIWILNQRESSKRQLSDALVQAMIDTKSSQMLAAQQSQSGEMTEASDPFVQQTAVVEGNLATLEKGDTEMARMALLEEIKLLRSRLYFSAQLLSDQEKQDLLTRIQSDCEKLDAASEGDILMQGMARMGLAMVAEERGDWDAAREIYQKFSSDKDTWGETQFPFIARKRLADMKDWRSPVVFAEPSEEPAADETTSDSSDTTMDSPLNEMVEDAVGNLPSPMPETESEEAAP